MEGQERTGKEKERTRKYRERGVRKKGKNVNTKMNTYVILLPTG